MRIVTLSDTHMQHEDIEVPDGDVLLHAGDFTGMGRLEEVIKFLGWFEKQPHLHKVFIAGNHDFLFQDNSAIAKAVVSNRDFIYLEDDMIEIDRVKFYGSPWQPWFYDWAFNLERGEEIAKKWDMIPGDTDVLITHGPPRWIRDWVGKERVGCEDLSKRILKIKPKIHVFGHIHEGYGVDKKKNTIFVNASNCNSKYEAVNKPIVLDNVSGVWEVVDG